MNKIAYGLSLNPFLKPLSCSGSMRISLQLKTTKNKTLGDKKQNCKQIKKERGSLEGGTGHEISGISLAEKRKIA